MRIFFSVILLVTLTGFSATPKTSENDTIGSALDEELVDLKSLVLSNKTPYIPAQCYTNTEDGDESVHNPCYSCHTEPQRPNFTNDSDLQLSYIFPGEARKNPWSNLFKDREQALAELSNQAITEYIRTNNYLTVDGSIQLAEKLRDVPKAWDYDDNGVWEGYVPDAYFNFDEQGFDRQPDGGYSGWRAFAYHPFLGSFWPTNGSTDDVLIRLPPSFQTDASGNFDVSVYRTNLAIVEALFKEQDIAIEPVDERQMGGVDLDKDGVIGRAEKIRYQWAPLQNQFMWYVGGAYAEQQAGRIHLAAGLFPEGTEFLHTVRYIDVDEEGRNVLAPRMKEVRYARKRYWMNYAELERDAAHEIKEDYDFPDRLHTVRGNVEAGISNDQGWVYAGFIEDAQGALRPQTFEELNYCYGCHGKIGATRDGNFSFHRKFDTTASQQGWYHWSQKGLDGIAERIREDGEPEYSYYLRHNHGGDEFRANEEVIEKFFDRDGLPVPEMFASLRNDISLLLQASPQRALLLNKLYRIVVQEQSFVEGRDTVIAPVANVHEDVEDEQPTGVTDILKGF